MIVGIVFVMILSLWDKFDLENVKNLKKKSLFEGLPFPEKYLEMWGKFQVI